MNCSFLSFHPRRVIGLLAAGVGALNLLAGITRAETVRHHYVTPEGRKLPLVRSDDEWAVVYRSKTDAIHGNDRLSTAGFEAVEEIGPLSESAVKFVRGPREKKSALRTDPTVSEVRTVYRFEGDVNPMVSTGSIAVKLVGGLRERDREQLWRDYGVSTVEVFPGLQDVYMVRVDDAEDEVVLAERLAEDGRTRWAQPNFRRRLSPMQAGASDAFFTQQWHLNNTGQFSGAVVDADIDAPEAWSLATGEGVLVGMFDDCCDVDHEDLAENYIGIGQDVALPSTVPEAIDPRPQEFNERHGTAVMGLACAAGNDVGVRGVAFRANFTASRGLLDPLVGDEQIARAYTFALERRVDVHINSWGIINQRTGGGAANPAVLVDAIRTAVRNGRDLDGPGPLAPLGMVVVFAAGNTGAEVLPGFSLASLPEVIGIGSSTTRDAISTTSSFGSRIDVLAPGSDPVDGRIATTDNQDGDQQSSKGYNVGGFGGFGRDIDPNGNYTSFFGGTSASCPIAAGVAALMLSANPQLTADDVRIILEHTADKVSPDDAQYDDAAGRSLRYGFGRINAHSAVLAAREAATNGNRTWPDVAGVARADGSTLRWMPGAGTDDFLVVTSDTAIRFAPTDGACYDAAQSGCATATLAPLPAGVQLLKAGCVGDCNAGTEQDQTFTRPLFGRRSFGIYGHSSLGQYSWGVSASADAVRPPSVTISASPLEGPSPLTVRFNGNAVSELAIDPNRTVWDFDLSDANAVDAATALTNHTYTASAGETAVFTARLTMYDVAGNAGSATVQIRVIGEELNGPDDSSGSEDLRIVVGVPGSRGSDDAEGVSPFAVELRLVSGAAVDLQSVVWDLGDGSAPLSGLVVPHTYINTGPESLVIPVNATITILTPRGTAVTTATRVVTVLPGTAGGPTVDPVLPGTTPQGEGGRASPCGALGLVPLLFAFVSLYWLRRHRP